MSSADRIRDDSPCVGVIGLSDMGRLVPHFLNASTPWHSYDQAQASER
jgi:hypothetical protein